MELALLVREAATEVDVDRLVTRISHAACHLVGCDYAGLVLVSADGRDFLWRGMVGNRTNAWQAPRGRRGTGPIARAAAEKRTIVVERLYEHPEASSRTQVAEGGRTVLTTPLPSREGLQGVLILGWRTDVSPTQETISMAETLAAHAAVAVDGALLREQRQAHEQRASAVLRVTRAFAVQADRDEVLRLLLDEAVHLLGATAGVVRRFDDVSHSLQTVAVYGLHGLGTTLTPVLVPLDGADVEDLMRPRIERCGGADAPAQVLDTQSQASAPILSEGRFLGTVLVGSPDSDTFSPLDLEVLEVLAGAAAAALVGAERAELRGILLAAATAQHEINNRLALTVGYNELLASDPRLTEGLKPLTQEALRGARECAEVVATMQGLTSVNLIVESGPMGPSLRQPPTE